MEKSGKSGNMRYHDSKSSLVSLSLSVCISCLSEKGFKAVSLRGLIVVGGLRCVR